MVSEHVRLPPALLKLVDALARAEGRSRSDMLRELVRRGFQVSPPRATP